MMGTWTTGAVVLLASLLAACALSPERRQAEEQALLERARAWAVASAAGDLEAGMAFWAEDAVLLPPGLAPVEGKAAIRAYLEGLARIPGAGLLREPRQAHVAAGGDLAWLSERHVSTLGGPDGRTITNHAKAVTIWRKDDDGSWRVVLEIWNAAPVPRE